VRRTRVFRNGWLAAAGEANLERADVLVEGAEIAAVGRSLTVEENTEEIACEGKVLLPGLFDLHTHLPGDGEDDLARTAAAAARGGFTGLVLMPDGSPVVDEGSAVVSIREKARNLPIGVHVAGCITRGGKGEALAAIADMKQAGAVLLTDGDVPVVSAQLLRRALEYARSFDLRLASHCDTPSLSAGGVMNEGVTSYQLGLPSLPALGEEIAVERDLRLARYTQGRIHVRSLTTRVAVDLVRRAKEEGLDVTAEVCPHHLLFDETEIGDYNPVFKVNPPLRTAEDRAVLRQGLADGVIDVLATDHWPHSAVSKNTDFESAPFGMAGLETALVSLFQFLVKPGLLGWGRLVDAFAERPRSLTGQPPVRLAPGSSADFVVFDPEGRTRFTAEDFESNNVTSPFLHCELDGAIREVRMRGKAIRKE